VAIRGTNLPREAECWQPEGDPGPPNLAIPQPGGPRNCHYPAFLGVESTPRVPADCRNSRFLSRPAAGSEAEGAKSCGRSGDPAANPLVAKRSPRAAFRHNAL
jgi:hypothetical protein